MAENDSVSLWIVGIQRGDPVAARRLWERYYARLVRFARRRIDGQPRRVADEEDIAISAFESFCKAARMGRFPDLADREGLWRLLLTMTARKATDLARYNDRRPEPEELVAVIGDSPTPEFAAIVREEYARLLGVLEEPELQRTAVAKMNGLTNREIARELDCSVRTVERQLHLIRILWQHEPV